MELCSKKEIEVLQLKTDNFVVENNVHFPADYNLLWDCLRKCIDMIDKISQKHGQQPGWRKSKLWRRKLKSLMRQLGRACGSGGKNKESRMKEVATLYLNKSRLLSEKVKQSLPQLPVIDVRNLAAVLLIVDYQTVDNQSDSDPVIALANRLTPIFKIGSWSFGIPITTPCSSWSFRK